MPAERLALPAVRRRVHAALGRARVRRAAGPRRARSSCAGSSTRAPGSLRRRGRSCACSATSRPRVIVDGRSLPLGRRQAEILALLCLRPDGLTTEQLGADVYGDDASNSTRARRGLAAAQASGVAIADRPLPADRPRRVRRRARAHAAARGAVRRRPSSTPGPLLPHSDAPGVERERDALEGWMRHAVMTGDDREALWAWVQSPSGRDDPAALAARAARRWSSATRGAARRPRRCGACAPRRSPDDREPDRPSRSRAVVRERAPHRAGPPGSSHPPTLLGVECCVGVGSAGRGSAAAGAARGSPRGPARRVGPPQAAGGARDARAGAGRTVSTDRLIEGLWGDEPPASAPKMVQLYVSQLRRLLDGDGARIVTRGRGYELQLADGEVDAVRFERLLARLAAARGARAVARRRARPTSPTSRSPRPRSAASTSCGCARPRCAIDADLAAGRHAEVLGELDALVAAHPLREHLHAPADARAVPRRSPVGGARRLPRRARRRSSSRSASSRAPSCGGCTTRSSRRTRRSTCPRRRRRAGAGAAPAAARRRGGCSSPPPPSLLAGVAGVRRHPRARAGRPAGHRRGRGRRHRPRQRPDHRRSTRSGTQPRARVAAGAGSVWVANRLDGTVSRIDRGRDEVTTIDVGGEPTGARVRRRLAVGRRRPDGAASPRSTPRHEHGRAAASPSATRRAASPSAGGAVWVASAVDGQVVRHRPRARRPRPADRRPGAAVRARRRARGDLGRQRGGRRASSGSTRARARPLDGDRRRQRAERRRRRRRRGLGGQPRATARVSRIDPEHRRGDRDRAASAASPRAVAAGRGWRLGGRRGRRTP